MYCRDRETNHGPVSRFFWTVAVVARVCSTLFPCITVCMLRCGIFGSAFSHLLVAADTIFMVWVEVGKLFQVAV